MKTEMNDTGSPNPPSKNNPFKKDTDNDPTLPGPEKINPPMPDPNINPGIKEPSKNDPTRKEPQIDEPGRKEQSRIVAEKEKSGKTDPTRIEEPGKN